MNDLYKRFGYCIIPRNTLLFRSDTEYDKKEIFFGFDISMGRTYNISMGQTYNPDFSHDKIQIWQVLEDLKVISLITELNHRSFGKTAIPCVYKYLFGSSEDLSQHYIRAVNPKLRKDLSYKLKDLNYKGWFTSINEKCTYEVCLFSTELVYLKEKVKDNSIKYYNYNALEFIKIRPSDEVLIKIK